MIRRPTPLPLTRTERDALDQLIRRGARALSPAEGNRLLRLWQLDQAERLQERRTARGLDKLNRELRRRLKEAEARLVAPCTAPLPAPLGIGGQSVPVGPCIVTGPHDAHRDARGASWELIEGGPR